MRRRDPHDDPPRRRREPYRGPPVTLDHIRSHGVQRLLIYCSEGLSYHHSAIIDTDRWPDDTVLLDMDRRAVCTKCGIIIRRGHGHRPRKIMPSALASSPCGLDQ
jgi:hypothetical protein